MYLPQMSDSTEIEIEVIKSNVSVIYTASQGFVIDVKWVAKERVF